MFDVKEMGKKIRELRNKRSQDEVAQALGISRGALSFYENGERKPDADVIFRMCEYFDVTSDFLLGLSNVKSYDVELQGVCEYTGLSPKAIEKLNEMVHKSYERYEIEAISDLISDIYFYRLVDSINAYNRIRNRIKNKPFSYITKLPEIDPSKQTPQEKAETSAQVLLEDCGYVILTSEYEILDYYRQHISSLLIEILGE